MQSDKNFEPNPENPLPRGPRSRRRSRLGELRPIFPNYGRAKAGADSAAKKKSKCRAAIVLGLARLEKADGSRLPEVEEVARAAKVSTASVRRHCKENPEFGLRIQFRKPPSRNPGLLKEADARINQLEMVILSLSARNETLEIANRDQMEQIERLKTQLRQREGQRA